MNIIIIGEYSAFAKHLKTGFVSLGHKVICVKDSDGFKKIPYFDDDIVYDTSKDLKFLGRHIPMSNVFFFRKVNRYITGRLEELNQQFDLIIILCEKFISLNNFSVGVKLSYIEKQVAGGAKVIMTSCGGDSAYQIFRRELWYYKYAFPRTVRNIVNERATSKVINKLNRILDLANCVVVTAYDYYYTINRYLEIYYKKDKPVHFIILPISETPFNINTIENRKISIFHGVIRPVHKGTPFIVEALDRIKSEYPDKVDVFVRGHMPYNEYIDLFEKIDILIDQCNGFGSGINTNIGLMSGKVVIANNEPEEEQLRGFKSPVINIRPDANQIYNVLKELILDPKRIDRIKVESREFAMKYLKSDIVAKSYLKFVNLA